MDFERVEYCVWVIREVVKPWADKVKALPPIVGILVVTRQVEVGFKLVAVTRFPKMIHLTPDP
jgi:hypothetical protein